MRVTFYSHVNGWPIQSGSGDWDELLKPGKTGFILVLMSLLWWRMAPGASLAAWEKAVSDVHWVLISIQSALLEYQAENSSDEGQSTAKRKRPGLESEGASKPLAVKRSRRR